MQEKLVSRNGYEGLFDYWISFSGLRINMVLGLSEGGGDLSEQAG